MREEDIRLLTTLVIVGILVVIGSPTFWNVLDAVWDFIKQKFKK